MNSDIILNNALKWIDNNTVNNGGGIVVAHDDRRLYPEVTGYYIPSLIAVGKINLAKSFAKHLCSIQKEDGSWRDANDSHPFIFDSGQILKGLVAIREYMPEVDENIIKGIDWIFSNMNEEGRLVQPNTDIWGTNDSYCNELIHIYCMSPIIEAGKLLKRDDYIQKANKVLDYYVNNYYDRIINFSLFSHFYAYVIEGLIDCGRPEISRIAMENMKKYVRKDGSICGWNDVKWVCSTAMFQFAIIWYKLGDYENANKTFDFACSLQNKTGGWYGSYMHSIFDYFSMVFKRRMYLRHSEISWAVKFFIDAYTLKKQLGC